MASDLIDCLDLVFQHWAKVYRQTICCIAVFSIDSSFKCQIVSDARERSPLRLERWAVNEPANSCNFCTETFVF